jgi:hypothetical protein
MNLSAVSGPGMREIVILEDINGTELEVMQQEITLAQKDWFE